MVHERGAGRARRVRVKFSSLSAADVPTAQSLSWQNRPELGTEHSGVFETNKSIIAGVR